MKTLVDNGEIGLLMLKLVEIIGSDEIKKSRSRNVIFYKQIA